MKTMKTMLTKHIRQLLLIAVVFCAGSIFAQQQSVQGKRLPSLTTAQRDQIQVIDNPFAKGMLIYNIDTDCLEFWDGERWVSTCGDALVPEGEAELHCTGTMLDPSITIMGNTPIHTGVYVKIPYSLSNGGSYEGVTLISKGNPDVTATIADGILLPGSGMLSFLLKGTPTLDQVAPEGIKFDLTPFLNANPNITGCDEVVIGHIKNADITQTAVMGTLEKIHDDDGSTVWALECDSPDGKFSVRVKLPGDATSVAWGNQGLNVQLRNNTTKQLPIIWNYTTFFGSGSLNGSGIVAVPSNQWGGMQGDGGITTWTGQTTPNGTGGYWGNIGIYDAAGTGPEYRRYTWIPVGNDNKISYEVTIMAALDTTTPSTAVHPTQLKAYVKFEQVTAL